MAARDSASLDLSDAMRTTLADHTWETTTPETILQGPTPLGFLHYPAIAVLSLDADEEVRGGLTHSDISERFAWSVMQSLSLDSVETQYRAHVVWRDEVRDVARSAINMRWNLPQVLISSLLGFDSNLVEIEGGSGVRVLVTNILMEVRYREPV